MLKRVSTFTALVSLLLLIGYNLCTLNFPTHKGAYYLAGADDVHVYPDGASVPGHSVPITTGKAGPETGRVEVYVSWLSEDRRIHEHASTNLWLGVVAISAQIAVFYAYWSEKKRA